jgi:formamidase
LSVPNSTVPNTRQPVYVPGAKLSVGDLHFSEGDGEPTTAIEMSGIVTLRVTLLPQGVSRLCLRSPMYITSPSEPLYPRRLVFTGLSTLPDGTQTDSGGLEAYRNAALGAIDYLVKFGFTREQAYILMSVAPVETKVVATANRPNFVVSLGLPLDIFHFDISPGGLANAPYTITGPAYLSDERAAQEGNVAGHASGH